MKIILVLLGIGIIVYVLQIVFTATVNFFHASFTAFNAFIHTLPGFLIFYFSLIILASIIIIKIYAKIRYRCGALDYLKWKIKKMKEEDEPEIENEPMVSEDAESYTAQAARPDSEITPPIESEFSVPADKSPQLQAEIIEEDKLKEIYSRCNIQGDMEFLGTDLVESSDSLCCCERCAMYRRRIYSLTGKDKRFPMIPDDFRSDCCGLILYAYIWDISEPSFQCADPIAYSNRPFVDDRTEGEKQKYIEWRKIVEMKQTAQNKKSGGPTNESGVYIDALEQVLAAGQASVSMLQRRLKLPYSEAAEIIDCFELCGIVGPFGGATPRKIYVKDLEQAKEMLAGYKKLTAAEQVERGIKRAMMCDELIRDEINWRREQLGLSTVECELHRIDVMEGHEFEHWCGDLLRKSGFTDVEVTKGSGDQGVDVIAVKDGIRYAIQCKCYSSDLGNKPVQEVHAGKVMYKCQVGVVMTNRHFTAGAKELADATGVLLWDRDKLEEMLGM